MASFHLDFAGIGAARSGTTWLASVLAAHPDIYMPPKKELHYFNNDKRYSEDLSLFTKYFEDAEKGQILGEFTPRYAISWQALERIKAHFPDIKIIYIMRHHVLRAYSQYLYFRSTKAKERSSSFLEALDGEFHEDYILKSLYFQQLQQIYELFPKDQVLVLRFEDISSAPETLVKTVFSFLGADSDFRPDPGEGKRNASHAVNSQTVFYLTRLKKRLKKKAYVPRILKRNVMDFMIANAKRLSPKAPKLDQGTIDFVKDRYFKEDIENLKTIGIDVSDWY